MSDDVDETLDGEIEDGLDDDGEIDDGEIDDGEYEPGDVNTVAADYEPGDVNTVGARRPRAAGTPSAPADGGLSVGLLEYLARAMSDDPDAVVIRKEERRGSTVLRLHVAPPDMGRVIGRRGRTAQAIRALVSVAGAREGVQTAVDIVDD